MDGSDFTGSTCKTPGKSESRRSQHASLENTPTLHAATGAADTFVLVCLRTTVGVGGMVSVGAGRAALLGAGTLPTSSSGEDTTYTSSLRGNPVSMLTSTDVLVNDRADALRIAGSMPVTGRPFGAGQRLFFFLWGYVPKYL